MVQQVVHRSEAPLVARAVVHRSVVVRSVVVVQRVHGKEATMRDYTSDALRNTTLYKDSEEFKFAEVIRKHIDADLREYVSILKDSSDPYAVDLIVRYKSVMLPFRIEVEQGDGWMLTAYPHSKVTGNKWRKASFLKRKFEEEVKNILYVKYSVPMHNCYFMWKETVWEYYMQHPEALRVGPRGDRNDKFIDIPWDEHILKMGLDALGKCVTRAIRHSIELGVYKW